MKVSIIIPTYNGVALTKSCLSSLKKNTPAELLSDIIVVDNASYDGTVEFLNSLEWLKVIFSKKNFGFSKACNQGAEKAKGDILVFLNNDTEVQKGWLEPLLETIREKDVAVAGSKMIFPNGLVQHAGIVISKKYIPQHIYYEKKADLPYVNKIREFQAVTAACMAIKKDIFVSAGGFDEKYLNGMEDIDLCLRVKELGYRIFYCPESVVVHHESVSVGRFKSVNKNEEIFLKRWKGRVIPDEEKYYREDGFGWFYIKSKNLRNKYLIGSGRAKDKPFSFKLMRVIYLAFHRIILGAKLVLKLDFKTLSKKIRKARDAG